MEREGSGIAARLAALAAAFSPIQQMIARHVFKLIEDRNPWSRRRGRKGPPTFIRRKIRAKFERRREARNRLAHESRQKNRGSHRGR